MTVLIAPCKSPNQYTRPKENIDDAVSQMLCPLLNDLGDCRKLRGVHTARYRTYYVVPVESANYNARLMAERRNK